MPGSESSKQSASRAPAPLTPPVSNQEEHRTETPSSEERDTLKALNLNGKLHNGVIDSAPDSPVTKLQKSQSWSIGQKLSREFKNASDQNELGLMSDKGEKLLALVDDIRKIDSLRSIGELDIPELVVVGDTSAGKSSVLQALTRLPFPVAGDFCTRFVTDTTIRRCGLAERPGYKIEVKMDNKTSSADPPFEPKTFDHTEWIEVYQKLKEDIADAFDAMSLEKLPPTRTPGSKTGAPLNRLLRHRLQITVRKPDQAHFSIVDIPGLVSGTTEEEIALSEELACERIRKPESIILAVTPAENVLENQKVLRLVRKEGASDRTIGVITKCDRIERTNEEKIFNLLRNFTEPPHNHLKLGWYAVRNRSPKEIIDEATFEERDKRELQFFGSGIWQEAVLRPWRSINANKLGVKSLKPMLSRTLYDRVQRSLPQLRDVMKARKTEYEAQKKIIGNGRDTQESQRLFLSGIQLSYASALTDSTEGNLKPSLAPNHPLRLPQHIKNFNDEFEWEIQLRALKYYWQEADLPSPSPYTPEGSNEVQLGNIFTWISEQMSNYRGFEPHSEIPKSLKKNLFNEQTESWERRATSYLDRVEAAIESCNENLFALACKDEMIRGRIRRALEPQVESAFEAARAELRNLIADRDYFDTWHPLHLIWRNETQSRRWARHIANRDTYTATTAAETSPQQQSLRDSSASNETLAADEGELMRKQISKSQEFYDTNKHIYETHDWIWAYWKVAYPRFVDNVICQVVHRHLLGAKGPLFCFNQAWVLRLTLAELEALAGEDEATVAERKLLDERLEGLEEALRKLDAAL